MQIDASFIIQLFSQPQLLCDVPEHQRPLVLLVLRQQKVLAKYAHLYFAAASAEQLDTKTLRHLRNALRIAEKQKEQVEFEADEITRVLAPVSRFVVFLKGAAYSLNNSVVGEGRIYSDIDILVNKSDLTECEQQLAINGWIGGEINDYDDKYYRKWAHEIPPLTHVHRGTNIDVHHNIIPVVSKDAPQAEILEQYIVRNKSGIQTLNIDAQFVHCCVHLFRDEDYKTAFRDILDLRYMLMDVNAFHAETKTALAQVMQIAKTLSFEYEVGLALYFVKYFFDEKIDDAIIEHALAIHPFRKRIDITLFTKVLLPKHPKLEGSQATLKLLAAEFRGHLIKMPLPLLIYHLTMKMSRGIIEKIMGKHFFSRKDQDIELE